MAVFGECGSIPKQRFFNHNFDVDVHMFDATSDSRIQRRQRVLKKALIIFNHGHTTIGCQVLDLSDSGAKLIQSMSPPAPANLC